jgi:hypothetical protein
MGRARRSFRGEPRCTSGATKPLSCSYPQPIDLPSRPRFLRYVVLVLHPGRPSEARTGIRLQGAVFGVGMAGLVDLVSHRY